jgi:hypothetical protein
VAATHRPWRDGPTPRPGPTRESAGHALLACRTKRHHRRFVRLRVEALSAMA